MFAGTVYVITSRWTANRLMPSLTLTDLAGALQSSDDSVDYRCIESQNHHKHRKNAGVAAKKTPAQ